MPNYTSRSSNGDVLLANAMPEAEYMYGCTPTAAAMLLGYYDLYGYRGADLSDIVEGDVDLKSRAQDGNSYNMNAFDTVLGRLTASEEYVYRFYARDGVETTPAQELTYSFLSDGKTLNTSIWNCLADYFGTGQYWRGNPNLSTTETYCTLEDLYSYTTYFTVSDGKTTRNIRYYEKSILYGLDLYVQSRGFALDREITGTYEVDVAGGSFTFADYMREIDSGRPVLISIKGHSMVGYGYNAETREIIFDDCYHADCRMTWDGTFNYSDTERPLRAITVIGINVNGDVDLSLMNSEDGTDVVIVAGMPGADATPEYIFEGDAACLTYSVSNLGTKESGDFRTSVRIDGELFRSDPIESIAGESTRKFTEIPLGELAVGLHNVGVIVDESNEVQEQTGRNNAAEQDILVLKPGTDILSGTVTLKSGETLGGVYVGGGKTLNIGGMASGVVLRGKITSSSAEGGIWTQRGLVNVMNGGYVSGLNVYGYGEVFVSSGGIAANTCVFSNGSALVRGGASLLDTTVESGGNLIVSSGGTLTGRLQLSDGASASVRNGAMLNFDLASVSPGGKAFVNDLSRLSGTPVYSLTVSGSQANGKYKLAEGAEGFDQTISVTDADGGKLAELNVGKTVSVDGMDYTLNLHGEVLSVTVGHDEPAPLTLLPCFVGDFAGTGRTMLVRESGGTISIYADGATVAELKTGSAWSLAGTGDFNGDGRDDLLKVHAAGLMAAELSNGDGTFSSVVLNVGMNRDILGTGDFNGNGTDDVLAAAPSDTPDAAGLLGFWDGGSEWNLFAGHNGEWDMVAVGDFDGDGTSDMLWRTTVTDSEGTLCYGYCSWLMGAANGSGNWKRIGALDQNEWEFLAAGDFDGDGTCDLAMINTQGVVNILELENGTPKAYSESERQAGKSAWTVLNEISTAEQAFAGAGDFDGDGTCDLAWCSLSTGLAEYWQITDKKVSDCRTIATLA